jgi:hypothetical protein
VPTAYETESFASLSRIVAAREASGASGASNHTAYARDVYRGIKEPKTQWTIGVAAVLEKFDDLGVVDFLVREMGGEYELTQRKTRYVKLVFVVHVGGTRCITSSTDNIMKILARITLNVEFIRTCIFIF